MATSNLQVAMRPLGLLRNGHVRKFVLWTAHDDRTNARDRILHRVLRCYSDAVELFLGHRTDPDNKFVPEFRRGDYLK